ncbi:MAG TPA: MBOAT family protein [Chthoniobacteraceae bacterium]|jgi:alginate O-acetyltransferase complex protein AlgI|nr:MBOAT family protein [Chthoniobacteraceae bacterium]
MNLAALPFLTHGLPPWVVMWCLAAAIYFLCKLWTLRFAFAQRLRPSAAATLGYLFLWPGMNAAAFLGPHAAPAPIPRRTWLTPLGKTAAGAALLWGAARHGPTPLLAGWVGMTGLILMLHFGLFGLAAAGWQRLGRAAPPLMRQPLRAHSLGDFWGRRWNTAFHDLVATSLFPPLRKRFGFAGATMLIFLGSGLVHDLVISVPAGGGYGLPTLYFVLQGAGLLLERSRLGRRLGLRRGARGRVLLFLTAAAPVAALFHPPFVRQVILPFLRALHAL